jgi:hypothetical protein
MFRTHGEFKAPDDVDVSIWRYVDLAKFLDMLERKALYFSRLDQLGDDYEGAPSAASIEWWRRYYEVNQIKTQGDEPGYLIMARDIYRMNRGMTYASCWHMNEYESTAMWGYYSREDIAIRSIFSRLRESLVPGHGDHAG